jgi:hypothetical protein
MKRRLAGQIGLVKVKYGKNAAKAIFVAINFGLIPSIFVRVNNELMHKQSILS